MRRRLVLPALLFIALIGALGYSHFKSFQFERAFSPSLFDSSRVKQITAVYGVKRIVLNRFVWRGNVYFYTTRNLRVIYYLPSIPWQILGSVQTIARDSKTATLLDEFRFKTDKNKIPVLEIFSIQEDGSSFKSVFYRASGGIYMVLEIYERGKPASIHVRKLSRNSIYALATVLELIRSL